MKETTIKDFPTCQFLKDNMKGEMDAIEGYSSEADRTDDLVWKRAISSIAQDEMRHHAVLESVSKRLKCEK
jgi:rubrerythrin